MSNDRVYMFDTTLRDGEQAAGAAMTAAEKLEVARQLERLKVDIIEAGFAASSPGDFQAVQTIAQEIREPIIASLARASRGDVDAAWEAIKKANAPRIHIFLSTSEMHILHMLKKDREEILEMAVDTVRRAKGYCSDVEFSAQDASRTDPAYLHQLFQAVIEAGATTINIADTVGYMIPMEFGQLVQGVMENVPDIGRARVSVHCHNDLGLAVANSLAAVRVGARQVEGCINGIGERAGNASLEEIIMSLDTRKDYFGATSMADTTQIYPTSRLVSDITGFTVQPNKAIVGANAFRHASGIHQDGVLKERQTYEIMNPLSVGLTSNALVLGKLSGRAGLKSRLEDLGYALSKDELDMAFHQFKELADKKREVTDQDLETLMGEGRRATTETQAYRLDHVQISSGTHDIPTATVRIITVDGHSLTDASIGNGPIDAVCQAIDRLVGIPNHLQEFTVRSITGGLDAVANVTIRIEHEELPYVGRGSDTDTLVATAKAYINALNRLIAMKGIPPSSPGGSRT